MKKEISAKREEGFTLIELLVVILVLGILAAIVVFALGNTTANATQKACKTEFRTVQTGQAAIKAATGNYSPDIAGLVPAYIKEAPSSTKYSITTDNTGAVTAGVTAAQATDAAVHNTADAVGNCDFVKG